MKPLFNRGEGPEFPIGSAAAILGIDVETLRFWDKQAYLPLTPRERGKWRTFTVDELALVALMIRAVRMGVPAAVAGRMPQYIRSTNVNLFLCIGTFEVDGTTAYAFGQHGKDADLSSKALWSGDQVIGYESGSERATKSEWDGLLGTVKALGLAVPLDVRLIDIKATRERIANAVREHVEKAIS